MADRWTACRVRRPDAPLRIYCFPHAGGSPGEYQRWADDLPGLEVWAVVPPGRGRRIGEAPLRRMGDLIGAFTREAVLHPPYALFGHSLGALVAFEVARSLRRLGAPGPVALIPSAYPAPHLPRTDPPVHALPDDELLRVVAEQYGGLPVDLVDDPDLREHVLATHRADFEIVETYRYSEEPPLSVPLTPVAGAADFTEPELRLWARHTTASCTPRLLPGGHFYFRSDPAALLGLIAAALATVGAPT